MEESLSCCRLLRCILSKWNILSNIWDNLFLRIFQDITIILIVFERAKTNEGKDRQKLIWRTDLMEKLNVAIADDNERIVDLLDHIVSSDNELRVVGKAGNGEELYDIIKNKEPDVVLLDIIMPKVDGLTVMERVNQDKEVKKRPAFIVITAVGQEKITEDAFALGANYYILKPFDNDMVINRIKHVRRSTPEKNFQEVRKVNA